MMNNIWKLFILTAIAGCCLAERANPLKDPHICGRPQCDDKKAKFYYNPNIHYVYDYNAHVRTEFDGTGQNSSDIYVTGTVTLTFPKKCEGILKVSDIELREKPVEEAIADDLGNFDFDASNNLHNKSLDFAYALQKNDMRFSYHDGVIGELCPELSEPNWVANFKRGILSSFQNSMRRFDVDYKTTETDISGTCDVNYVVNGVSKTSLLIQKRKDISTCINRYKTNSVLQTTPYDFRKQYSVLPILQTISYCNITIDHNIYQDVVCYERHQLVPFSNNSSGAVTTSIVNLMLVDEESYEIVTTSHFEEEDQIKKRETLLFNHYPTPKQTTGEIKASRKLLQKMCKLGFPDIKRQFIDVFSKFLQTARLLSSTALHQLFARGTSICNDNVNGRNHILESLPYIGSTASVEMMTQEIMTKTVSGEIAQKWLTSMSFLPRPDEGMLQFLYMMLEYERDNLDPIFIFAPTSVVHTFCRHHADCGENRCVQKFVKFLEENANAYLAKDLSIRVNRERAIVLLKGIGNIGIMSKSFRYDMREIIQADQIPVEIRVYAISAHRRVDCAKSRDFFLDIYRNFTANSELRIASYLEAMRCPDYISVKHIKYVLKNEEVNQVGSFVWSHLKNIANSASPVRVAAQGLLVDDDLGTKYRLDLRKFSHNFEHSMFFDQYNVGTNTDVNLIFGTDSYMPRSTSLNFTIDLFGESINIFEISAYMQGFEHMVEGMFGPKGPLSAKGFSEKMDSVKSYLKEKAAPYKVQYLDHLNMRLRRDAKQQDTDVKDIDDEYDLENDNSDRPREKHGTMNYAHELQNDVDQLNFDLKYSMNKPRAAIALKMFGNEIKYKTLEDIREVYTLFNQVNPMNQIKQLLSGKDIIYTKSGVFLDASYEVPLSSGFPLSLQTYGASSVDLRMSGMLQGDNFWTNPKFAVKGKLKPSISLDMIATLQSDYFYGSSGIRVKSNLYSSSSVEANLTVDGKNFVSLQFGLPQDRNDIISARSELIVLQYEREIRQRGIQKRYTNSTCTWPGIERAVGLKVCSDYSLPDVSKSVRPLPSLLLCGPIDVNIHIDKADLTAKTFLFEYKWIDSGNQRSIGSFIFETPNTKVPKMFSANLTKEPDIYKLAMSFENGKTMHSATATYKNTNEEKLVEAQLRIDGQKSFAMEMGMNKTAILNGWIFYPKFTLAVNNDQIAGLTGTVKMFGKNKITQYDPHLEFETKKFKTRLSGYVTTTDTKLSTRLILNYKFLEGKEEIIDFESELEGTGDGYKTSQVAMLKWNSTAYHKYNFKANINYKRVLGHMDLAINVNNAVDFVDPRYNLGVKLALIQTEPDDKEFNSRTNFSVEIIRPISKINYKFMVRYNSKNKRGPLHNLMFLLRYAEGKEATVVISAMLPSTLTHNTDLYLNVTVPGFNSCTARFQSIERARRTQYDINAQGTWFTGHSITIYGTYDDKSSAQESKHQLKLVVKSPHFEETTILARYLFNETVMMLDTNVEYGGNPYGLILKHHHVSLYEQSVYAELKILEKFYWISARLSDENFRKLSIDLHIDRVREIRVIIGGQSTPYKKEIEAKISWDSNRDPTQELFLNIDFNTPKPKTYDGGFTISYPQRTFSGSFDVTVPGPTYKGNASIGWSANETIHISFDSGAIYGLNKNIWINMYLQTPFSGWHNNRLQSQLFYSKNLLSSNASILWADTQKLVLGILTDYDFNDPNIRCEAKFLVNSTVKEVPSIYASFKHLQDQQQYITDISIRHAPQNEKPNIFAINSNWQLIFTTMHNNITGSIMLQSPLKGYSKGALATKFSISAKKLLRGAADLELEGKRFTLAVAGMVQKLTDCMLEVNVTTPIAKYRNINGRFGLVNRNRHFVAEMRAPAGALGIEVKFAVNTLSDFDIIFNLETPIESFKKIMLIGKLKLDMVDFRGGLNNFVLGYVGVSRRESIEDFEYSWKVYTPLEKFEESSLVVKYIRKQIFDMEIMLKFAQKKLGVIVNGKPKQKLIGLPRIKHFLPFNSRLSDEFDRFNKYFDGSMVVTESDDDETAEDDEVEIDSEWNIAGQMELNTIIWPTISGFIDIEDIEEEYYIVRGNLNLPNGNVDLRDHLYFPDLLNIRNSLQIITPFQSVQEIELLYLHSVEFGHYYVSAMELFYKNQTNWVELGFNSNYTKLLDVDLQTHDIEVNMLLPFVTLPRVTLASNVEIGESTYRANVSGRTIDTFTSLAASMETDTNFIDIVAGLALSSPELPNYEFKVFFKKDLSDVESSLVIGFDEVYNKKSSFQVETTWYTESSNYLKLNGKLLTNLFPITYVETSVFLNRSQDFEAAFDLTFNSLSKRAIAFHVSAKKRAERVTIELNTPLVNFANVSLTGVLRQITQQGQYMLTGKVVRNREIYSLNGTVVIYANIPVDVNLHLKPVSRVADAYVTYSLAGNDGDYRKMLRFKIEEGNTFFDVAGSINVFSKLNWNVLSTVSASPGLLSKKPNGNYCSFNASVKPDNDGRIFSESNLITPWRHLGVDKVNLNGNMLLKPNAGNIQLEYEFSLGQGRTICSWTFVILENMQALLDTFAESEAGPRSLKVGIRYANPGKSNQRLSFGGNLAVDSKINLETNGSMVIISKTDMSGMFAIRLPTPINDVHRFSGRYQGDVMASPIRDVVFETRYESDSERQRFTARGQYRNVTDLQALLQSQWGTDVANKTFETNLQMLRKGVRRELSAIVKTPLYTEETVRAGGFYDKINLYHVFNGSIAYPSSRQIASSHLEFSSLANVRGFINCSTPFPNVTWLQTDLNYTTSGGLSRRCIRTAWPQDFAFFDMDSTFESINLDRNHQGIINMEVPLASRHIANIEYGLKERKALTTGHCNVIYNKNNVLNGKYTCKSESRAGFTKDVMDITMNNNYQPVGVTYTHQTEQSGPDPPFFDMKRAEIYELRDSNRYNITGELHVRTMATGQAYKVIAIHPNRTVVITSDYDYQKPTIKQRSKLQLSPDVWIAYDFQMTNFTTPLNDSQMFSIDIKYPKRNLSTAGWYSITEDVFDTNLAFKWTKSKKSATENSYDDYDISNESNNDHNNDDENKSEERVIKAALKWRNEPLTGIIKSNQSVLFTIKHPSFSKDVTFNAGYYRSHVDLMRGTLVVDYHDDPAHLLTFEGGIVDSSSLLGHRNYSMHAFGVHQQSEFNLNALASVAAKAGFYETKNYGLYKRGYLPLQEGVLNAAIDFHENELRYSKVTPHKNFYVWVRTNGEYPIYTLNGTFEDSPDVNTTAEFYLNIDNRFVRLDANFTPDASQNLRMLGIIPDARSASFDLWRDYEDIRIVDIAYFLRMNHSRLITSQLIWRPKLKTEIKENFRKLSTQFYDSFSENIDFWVKTLYNEGGEAINDIWLNARPHAEEFLEDISGLRVIEDDIEEFRKLLNQSYEANDFYVKTMVNFTITILDELAIRNHIGSVPKILNEIWQVLGDSGAALRKSILWLMETVKTTYKNIIDVLNRIFHGEAMSYVSALVEKAVYSYDRIVKDLHLSFIKYVQNIWNNISNSVMDYWGRLLERIQPIVMRFIHYGESVLWNISQEIFEFLHKHTNDLVKSPYFDTVSEFMQDLDSVYRDIQTNDAITNIKKYSALAWEFLREKYFKVVPFGRELENLTNELADEIKQLQKQELVQFVINRIDEWKQKIAWFAEEFQLDKRMHQLWQIILNKISSYEQTALQIDDKYREAKTKFVFDPDAGIIKLEQKLPMSWHAFNETPLFEEISELRLLGKALRMFNGVNVSLIQFDVMQYYTNPYVWLPPFKSRSLLVGSRHYITFDNRFISLNHKYAYIQGDEKPDQCSYLLANDFVDSNFTLTQEPSITTFNDKLLSTRKLAIIADGNVIDVDIVGSTIRINRNFTTALPIQIGETVIYRSWDILVIRSNNGFELNCNLQFDLCWFEISGWYYGKTAGILGTMNNEYFDDFLKSNHLITYDQDEFKESWALKQCKHNLKEGSPHKISNELLNICDTYFRSKVSPFANCFATVDSIPFYEMCLDMGSNSVTNFTQNDHPAQKGACAVALAYMESCNVENLPLRVPEICVHCNLNNGSYVAEGHIFDLTGDDVPKTTDIVFIIEAKACNQDLTGHKNILTVIAALEKALNEAGLTNNRYAVVAFGGIAPFDNAHSIVYNNAIFTDSNHIRNYFDHIKTGNGNSSDISRAIKTASELVFRPGASKTFVLMPCSDCNVTDMHFDYSSVLQFLWENNINLHIFMNGDFETKKPRNEHKIFGFDHSVAYTNSYLKELTGDRDLRSEIILPKNRLGFCMVWALESNGTIFTANKLKLNSRTPIKKFSAVFAKRVAKAAIPSPCQTCECTGENTGIAYFTCTSCDFSNSLDDTDDDLDSLLDAKDYLETISSESGDE